VAPWQQCNRSVKKAHLVRVPALRSDRVYAYNRADINPNSRNASTMTRTPTTSVTAIAIAARAFAWGISIDAPSSGLASAMRPLSPQLP
jgi:hypothetical protein